MKKTLILASCLSGSLTLMAQEPVIKANALSLGIQFEEVQEGWNKQSKGTSIELRFQYEGNDGVVSFKDTQARGMNIQATDSTGKSMGPVAMGMFFPDNKSTPNITLPVTMDAIPTAGSTFISLDGNLPVILSTGKITTEPQLLALKKDNSAKLGVISAKVKSVNGSSLELILEYTQDIPPFILKFMDKDGKEVKVEGRGSMTSTMNKQVSSTRTYQLDSTRDEIRISVETWKESKSINVPVKIKVGLGGAEK